MGRGAKIFLVSALISAIIFGLISYVIISALVDRKKASEEPTDESESAYHEFYNYDNILEDI